VAGVLALSAPLLAGPAVGAPVPTTPGPTPTVSGQPTPSTTPGLTADGKPICAIRDRMVVPLPKTTQMPNPPKASLPTLGGAGLAGNGLTVPPGSPPLPTNVEATSWLVADLDTGEVLGACGAHRYGIPASVEKVLLCATVLPKLDPTTSVTITDEDVYGWGQEADASSIWTRPGEVYTVRDLFLGLLLRSGNDAANALARTAGGSRGVAGTIADMNATAHRLGAWDTHAATPSGLDPYQLPEPLRNDYQVTSAYDLALIFREAFKNQDFRNYLMTKSVTLPAQPGRDARSYDNEVKFNDMYPDGLGGKTGYTDLARHSFVGARERDGRRLVATILGAERIPFDNNAYKQAGALIDWGFSLPKGTSVGRLVQPGEADAIISAKAPPSRAPIAVIPSAHASSGGMLFVGGGAGAVLVLAAATAGLVVWRRRRVAPAAAVPLTSESPPAAEPGEPPPSPEDDSAG
jgi:D-alanyl-D-alanine carboxypeptidase (penicillin-binding protein 5/6)